MATETREVILDSTMEILADAGIARLALEDVAAHAGVSRQTVYRHFGNREGLIAATVVREEERFLAELSLAVGPIPDLRGALEAGIARMLEWTRDHPLLGRLLQSDPDVLVPLLTTGSGPVLAVARPAVEAVLAPRLDSGMDLERSADTVTRLLISYAVNPPVGDPWGVARSLASLLVNGLQSPKPE